MNKLLRGHIFLILLSIYVGVELLGHMVTLDLTFWGAAKLPHFTFLPAIHEGSNFSTVLPTLFCRFDYSHSSVVCLTPSSVKMSSQKFSSSFCNWLLVSALPISTICTDRFKPSTDEARRLQKIDSRRHFGLFSSRLNAPLLARCHPKGKIPSPPKRFQEQSDPVGPLPILFPSFCLSHANVVLLMS